MNMITGMLSNSRWWVKLTVIFAVTLAVLCISSLIPLLFKIDTTTTAGIEISQVIISVATFGGTALLCAILLSTTPVSFLALDRKADVRMALLAAGAVITALPAINITTVLNEQLHLPESLHSLEELIRSMEEEAERLTLGLVDGSSITSYLIMLVVMALVPAICEELFFRGMMQSALTSFIRNKHIVIWTTAFIFSFIHFQFLGFIPRMLLGALFGYVVHWTGSIWITIIMHFINNGLAVTLLWIIDRYGIDIDPDTIGATFEVSDITTTIVSTTICILFLRRIMIYGRDKKQI